MYGFVAMLNPIIKPTSRNPEHLSHTDNTEAQQVFEHKFIAIYFRFFAMYGIHSFSAKLRHRQEHENEVSSC